MLELVDKHSHCRCPDKELHGSGQVAPFSLCQQLDRCCMHEDDLAIKHLENSGIPDKTALLNIAGKVKP